MVIWYCQLLQIVATYLTGGLVFYYFRVTIAPIVVLCAGGLVLAAECFVRLRVSDYNIAHAILLFLSYTIKLSTVNQAR
jgi:hypothetical protein